jgi:hypothetical protein
VGEDPADTMIGAVGAAVNDASVNHDYHLWLVQGDRG